MFTRKCVASIWMEYLSVNSQLTFIGYLLWLLWAGLDVGATKTRIMSVFWKLTVQWLSPHNTIFCESLSHNGASFFCALPVLGQFCGLNTSSCSCYWRILFLPLYTTVWHMWDTLYLYLGLPWSYSIIQNLVHCVSVCEWVCIH